MLGELGMTEGDIALASGTGSMWTAIADTTSARYWENLMSQAIQSGKQQLIDTVAKQALKTGMGMLTGGSGGGLGGNVSASFGGFTGGNSLEMLQDLNGIIGMSGTIPQAKNGWDYIPRNNTLVNTHEGEAVLNKDEAAAYRAGKRTGEGGGGRNITVNFNLSGTVIDRSAVNEFAEMIYPRLKKLEAWGH